MADYFNCGGCPPNYDSTFGSNDVESISFNNIVDQAIIDLASIGVTDIIDMLTIDERIDGLNVIMQILKNTIDKFEYHYPFSIDIYPYYTTGRSYRFIDNFWEFLEGKVNRANLQLVPRVIVAIIGTYLGTLRGVRYEPPYMYNVTYSGQFRTTIIANRPYKMERNGIRFTDESRYYYLSENYKQNLYVFRLMFKLNLGNYIIRLNENLDHPNLPLTTFQGLQKYVSDLESEYKELLGESFGYYGIYSDQ